MRHELLAVVLNHQSVFQLLAAVFGTIFVWLFLNESLGGVYEPVALSLEPRPVHARARKK